MISPKEKAIELFEQMYTCYQGHIDAYTAKQCALITVDEILQNFGQLTEGANFYTSYNTIKFYQEVKQELEKL